MMGAPPVAGFGAFPGAPRNPPGSRAIPTLFVHMPRARILPAFAAKLNRIR